jgi:hypothetical protein
MHVFTSITANYLPKAAALAHSVKRVHPEAVFHLVLSDEMPACDPTITAAFDTIIQADELPIPNLPRFLFRHRIVELCTAVKGAAFQHIADVHKADRIYYFDPDIIVAGRLDDLERQLDHDSVLLTPHSIEPESDVQAMMDNERIALRHGAYNLGFLAAKMDAAGRRVIDWWSDRLRRWCYDEVAEGLFTDQRWMDLAPSMFDSVKIVRDPQYNVSTWNLSHRRADGESPYGIAINGRPLVFYHFSGFDSGAQLMMLKRYGSHSPVLFEFRDWYIAECERLGQSTLGKIPCVHTRYKSGLKIEDAHRKVYRSREDLVNYFADPFDDSTPETSFLHWYRTHVEAPADPPPAVEPEPAVDVAVAVEPPPSLRRLVKEHAPEPARKAYRSARSAWRKLAGGRG